jgi:GNAT superfamily N-acetyltransferase
MVHVVAWTAEVPIGRGMVLFPEHEEYSTSAVRESCAEVRDVFVVAERRREGIARAIMTAVEGATRDRGFARIGLTVSTSDDAEPARRLYDAIGYRHAHGPFISSGNLRGDDGPIPVGAVMTYLVKEL